LEVTASTLSFGSALAATASASDESTPPENATSALPRGAMISSSSSSRFCKVSVAAWFISTSSLACDAFGEPFEDLFSVLAGGKTG
jgi:hypothetical protein